MCAWTDFYEGRLLDSGYKEYVAERYGPFIQDIVSQMKSGDRVIEVGCGLGTITKILTEYAGRPFVGFRAFDLSPDMVHYARLNLRGKGHEYPVDVHDVRFPTRFKPDIVHSHGLLEHFNDEGVEAILAAHREDGARVAIHYVPGEKYEKPSFGDERLLPLAEWVKKFEPSWAFDFNEGYDYCLAWKF